jgi:hypothetical protein
VAYKPPESKREGCHYPNCSGYIEVPFCCHDPEALPAKKARLAQIETPKREWVGLTDEELVELRETHQAHIFQLMFAIEAKLKEKNNGST